MHCRSEPHSARSLGGYNFGVPDYDPDIDYYEVLQVHPQAHQEVIKRAYRTIMAMLQGHPDLGGDHEAAVRINQAYAVLSDEGTRKAYDAARQLRKGSGRTAPRQTPPPPQPRTPHTPGTGAARPRTPHAPETDAARPVMYCPHCGTRNRLRHGGDLRLTVCGKCGQPLQRPANGTFGSGARLREIRLQRRMDRELTRHGEIHLHPVHVPRGKPLQCLRCHYEWPAPPNNGMPERCPNCRSRLWSDFRLFLCRHCRERFSSSALIVIPYLWLTFWPWPYWVFPACPACGRSHWHLDCEVHPLRGVLNLFSGAMKEM
ncbi:MAG: J domain-containing protein [Armatimonadota bacterium]